VDKERGVNGMSYSLCFYCNGTGIDDADWRGRCCFCHGTGLLADEEDEPGRDAFDDEEDNEEARA
jgi:hypothetical protein